MSKLTATCCFLLQAPMHFPVEGQTGDYLAVMPPPLPENLWVLEPAGLWVVRRRHCPEGKLWTVLADLVDAGTLSLVHAPGRQFLMHLVESGQLSAAQAVRVLRAG
ncbi:hypothetical protein MASR1M101_41900 [Gemmatimonas sp.]